MSEKKEFSERLRAAMKAQGWKIGPASLERAFNEVWGDKPIGRQTAFKWLNGQAIPTQDKLQVLAHLLRTEPHLLRYGDRVLKDVRARQRSWDEGVGYVERETFEAFLLLPAGQRKLLRDLILALGKANPPETPGRS